MSRLLKIVLNNSKQKLTEQFDLSSSINRMTQKLNSKGRQSNIAELPVEPEASTWKTVIDNMKTYMFKKYNFPSYRHVLYFLNESLEKSNNINHHPIITIDNNSIEVILYTHTLNDVSELDIDMSRYFDELYEDITIITRM